MKQLSPLRLALVFAGCFLGAGYISGQELWQFFGSYGGNGYIGILAAILLLFGLGFITLRLAQLTGEQEVDRIVVPWKIPVLRLMVSVLEVLLFFGVMAIMSAGVGALTEQLFGIAPYLSSLVFCLLVLLIALSGLKGLVSVFSASVPVLVIVTVLFGIICLSREGFSNIQLQAAEQTNPLLGGWFMGAMNFSCYNVLGAFAIMLPFGKYIKDRSSLVKGLGLGAGLLLLIALSVLVCMGLFPETALAELPMLYLAQNLSGVLVYVYALLLAAAMFGTSVSSIVGLMDFLEQKFQAVRSRRSLWVVLLSILTYALSLMGYGDLIGVMYPLFGYACALFIVLLVVHYVQVLRKMKNEK